MDGINATLFGAQLAKSPTNENNYAYGFIGVNGTQFTDGDIVTKAGTGGLIVCPPSTPVLGIVAGTQLMAANNQALPNPVMPAFIPIDQDYEFLMGTNADLNALTSPGTYYNITGTTGAQQVDVASGPLLPPYGIVMCTKVDPNQLGGTGAGSGARQGYFKFVRVLNYHSVN